MKVVVELLATAAMLSEACQAWIALAIMADATDVATALVGKKNVGAKVDGLSKTLKLPTSARQFSQFHVVIYRDEHISVFWNCLGHSQRAKECNA